MQVFLADLTHYSMGKLTGKWLTLPMDREYLTKEIEEIVGIDSDYLIYDYSSVYPIHLSQFFDVFKLNDLMVSFKEIVSLHDQRVILASFRYFGELEDVINCLKESNYSMIDDVTTTEELGLAIVKQDLIHVPDYLNGFNYQEIGEEFESFGYVIYPDLRIGVSFY